MKKVTLVGKDGKELTAYFCSDHPLNFPTDMSQHKVEDVVKEFDAWHPMGLPTSPPSDYSDPDHPLNKHDEGQMYNKWHNESPVDAKTEFDSDPLNKLFSQLMTPPQTEKALVDDFIESDIVDEPKIGKLYKVKGLNMVARYVGIIPMSMCASGGADVSDYAFWQMRFHSYQFCLSSADRMLLKASQLEVNKYLGK